MASSALNPVVRMVTDRIRKRSKTSRESYLAHVDRSARSNPARAALSCTNFAHGFAAFDAHDKLVLRQARQPNIAIVSSYNDMLSAHQPLGTFPADHQERGARGRCGGAVCGRHAGDVRRRDAGRTGHGVVAVFARRDRNGDRGCAFAQHVRRHVVPRHLRQDRAGPCHRRFALRPLADDPGAGRPR